MVVGPAAQGCHHATAQAQAQEIAQAAPSRGPTGSRDTPPLSVQIADLDLRARACEARLGVASEAAEWMLRQVEVNFAGGRSGQGGSLEQMAEEVAKGKAQLMLKEDSMGTCQPVRVVEIVLLRLWSMKDGGSVLLEERGPGLPSRLPGHNKERNETPKDVATRIRSHILKMGDVKMHLNYEKTDVYFDEVDTYKSPGSGHARATGSSPSKAWPGEHEGPPGLRTLYRMEIIEGFITTVDLEQRGKFNMDQQDGNFTTTDRNGQQRTFQWVSEEQALDMQVKLRGDPFGSLSQPVLTPIEAMKSNATGSVCQRAAEVRKKVDVIFTRDKKLTELERSLGYLEAWINTDPSQALSMVLQERAKRKFVAQHAHHLHEFSKVLAEIRRLEHCINPPSLQELPGCDERLRRLEARGAVAVSAASRLHDHVAQVAEDYHKAMVGLNDQLLRWNGLLDNK